MKAAKYIVEFIGAFFLVFTVGMTVIHPDGPIPLAAVAIGCSLMMMVYAGGHVSGGHYNPAVTLAVTLRGKCPVADALPYVIAQVLAAVAAAYLVLHLKQDPVVAAKALQTGPTIIAEFLFTFALCYVVLNAATAKANAGNSFYGLAIGFTVVVGALAVGPVSGAALNPAVAIGACCMGLLNWSDVWMHLAGEIAGAAAAAVAFKTLVSDQG